MESQVKRQEGGAWSSKVKIPDPFSIVAQSLSPICPALGKLIYTGLRERREGEVSGSKNGDEPTLWSSREH